MKPHAILLDDEYNVEYIDNDDEVQEVFKEMTKQKQRFLDFLATIEGMSLPKIQCRLQVTYYNHFRQWIVNAKGCLLLTNALYFTASLHNKKDEMFGDRLGIESDVPFIFKEEEIEELIDERARLLYQTNMSPIISYLPQTKYGDKSLLKIANYMMYAKEAEPMEIIQSVGFRFAIKHFETLKEYFKKKNHRWIKISECINGCKKCCK